MKNPILQLSTSASFAFLALFPQVAFAASNPEEDICPAGDFSNLCKLKADQFSNIISTAVTVLFLMAIVITLFFLIWGGIRWTASGGDKAKVESARGTIIAAIIGLVIALLSYFIINLVLYVFTGNGISGLSIPTLY